MSVVGSFLIFVVFEFFAKAENWNKIKIKKIMNFKISVDRRHVHSGVWKIKRKTIIKNDQNFNLCFCLQIWLVRWKNNVFVMSNYVLFWVSDDNHMGFGGGVGCGWEGQVLSFLKIQNFRFWKKAEKKANWTKQNKTKKTFCVQTQN